MILVSSYEKGLVVCLHQCKFEAVLCRPLYNVYVRFALCMRNSVRSVVQHEVIILVWWRKMNGRAK